MPRNQRGFYISGAVGFVAYGGFLFMHWSYGTLRAGQVPQTIAWYLLAFIAFVGALIWVERVAYVPLKLMWGTAVGYRLLLLFTVPTLSDDVYRYLWDGYIANQGVSPYAYAIDAPALDYLDSPQRNLANNRWMASPYLPVAQLIFRGLTTIAPLHPLSMQLGMVVFDLLSAVILTRLLALAQLPPRRLLLYLWNPLVIVEVAHGAHIDAWMVLLMLLAIWLALTPQVVKRMRSWGSPLLLALSTLTKILPILLTPVLFWRWSWGQRLGYGVLSLLLLLPAGLRAGWGLTGPLDGRGLFGALRIYSDQWKFNSGIFHWLTVWLGKQGIADPDSVGKRLMLVLMVTVLTTVWLTARSYLQVRPTMRLMAVPLIAYLLLTTTVHPWYSLALMPFLPFLPPKEGEPLWLWWFALPWLYLCAAFIFSYLTYIDPSNFGERESIRQLEWLPTLGLLVVSLGMMMKHRLSHAQGME